MKPDKHLQQLIDRVAELEGQRKQIEQQLSDAAAARYAYERKMRRNEKLTPAMLDVLDAIARGGELSRYEFNHPYRYSLQLPGSDEDVPNYQTVRGSVASGLIEREAIRQAEKRTSWTKYFEITEHGRAIIESTGAKI